MRLINLWRPIIDHPVYDRPLAFADFNTLPIDKLQPSDLIYSPDQIGETLAVAYSPETRWYYLRHQTIQEATMLKCFESKSLATPEAQAKKPGIAALTVRGRERSRADEPASHSLHRRRVRRQGRAASRLDRGSGARLRRLKTVSARAG